MKKYKLKDWVENLLLALFTIFFTMFLVVVEKSILLMIIDKTILLAALISIGYVLVEYTDMEG